MKKETLSTLTSKLLLTVVLIIGIGTVIGLIGYVMMKESTEIKTSKVKAPKKIIEDKIVNWQTYSNPQNNFTFEYPSNWKIIEDYFYKTAAGIKAKNPTIVLQKISDDNSNNWIRINQRQFNCELGKCVEADYITIGTYSKNPETLTIFNRIAKSFKKTETDETSNWKTYRNEKYGFEVKYPKDWKTYITNGGSVRVENILSKSSLEILENNNNKKLSLYDWVEKSSIIAGRPTITAAAKPIIINGVKAYKLESELNSPNPLFNVAIADKNNRIFTLYSKSKNLDDSKVLNQMLLTFKFIEIKLESDLDTSDWLTYNSLSTAEGYYAYYKIKYPRDWYYDEKAYKRIYSNSNKKPLHAAFFSKKEKIGLLNYQIEVLSEKDKNSLFNTDDYFIRKVRIGNKDFEEIKNKRNNLKTFSYKTGYSNSTNGNYYIVFRLFDVNKSNQKMLIASLNTFQFLGNDKKNVIIGANEKSFRKMFKNEEYKFQIEYPNNYSLVNNIDNLSLIFVDNLGMYSNISVVLAKVSGVATVEQWLEREATINKNIPKKSEWEYYRIGDSNEIGIAIIQPDATETSLFRIFYAYRGQYLFAVRAPIIDINNFVYYHMISSFKFLEPKNKLIGLKSKWVIDNVFEFNEKSGQFERILNENEFYEREHKFKDIKWYETKTIGIIPDEIKIFFPSFSIFSQGLMDTNDWKHYQNKTFEFLYPKEWEIESYSNENTLYFNVTKSRNNELLPKLTIMIDRNPIPIETLSIVDDVKIIKFGQVEAIITSMHGKKGETNRYSYLNGKNNYYIEFNINNHDYFIEFDFFGGDYNKNRQTMYTILSSFKFTKENEELFSCGDSTVKDIDGNIYNTVKIGEQC